MSVVIHQVKENLLFHNLWTEVSEIQLSKEALLTGKPKEKLLADEEKNEYEIVLPIKLTSELSVRRLNNIFNELELLKGSRPKRILAGIVNDDSTVVYYFVHDGVYKPKKN